MTPGNNGYRSAEPLVFVVLVAFMAWGPFHRQVLKIREPLFRTWTMFSGIGVGVVDARFYQQFPDGRWQLLDRYTLLGYENRRGAPRSVCRLRRAGSAAAIRPWRAIRIWALEYEGSTRSCALIRIGLVLLIWTRWANELLVYKSLDDWQTLLLCLNFFVATTLMGIGLFSRFATAWTAVDRWLAVSRAERLNQPPPPESGSLLGMRLIAIQLSLLYFWTAVDKSGPHFLGGDRLEHLLMWYYIGSNYPHHLTWLPWLLGAAAWFVVIVEYVLARACCLHAVDATWSGSGYFCTPASICCCRCLPIR